VYVLGSSACQAYDLQWPDIVHNIYIGMFDHVETCCESFLQRNGKAAVFDMFWAGILPYPIVLSLRQSLPAELAVEW